MSSRWLPLAGLAGAFVAVTVGCSDANRDRPEPLLPRGVAARLNIVVTEPDLSIRTAELECAGQNKASGYLARPNSRAFACETAIINPSVLDYLTGHEVSGSSCTKTFNPPPPSYVVHFEGAIGTDRVSRTLNVAHDPCGEALAVLMFPLLESTAEGPSLGRL